VRRDGLSSVGAVGSSLTVSGNLSWFHKKRINSNWQQLQWTPGVRLVFLIEHSSDQIPFDTVRISLCLRSLTLTQSQSLSGIWPLFCLSVCLFVVCLWCAAKVQKVTQEIKLHSNLAAVRRLEQINFL